MRVAISAVVIALLAAGCVKDPSDAAGSDASGTPPTTTSPTPENSDAPVGNDTVREPSLITAYLGPGYTLSDVLPAEGTEPETLDPGAFFTLQLNNDPAAWAPWKTGTSGRAREVIGEVEVQIRFRASQAAQQSTPKAAGFPGAGGWIGSRSGWNTFYLMNDAPERLEAGVTHKASAKIQMPNGGLFLLPDEPFSPHIWTAYKLADNTPIQYVLGGDDPAFVRAMLRPVVLPPVRAVEVLSESGTMGPHPGVTTEGNADAVDLQLTLPEGTVYVVLEGSGARDTGSGARRCGYQRKEGQ